MCFYVLQPQTLFGFYIDESAQKILKLGWYFPVDQVQPTFYLRVEDWSIVILKRQFGHNHGKQNDPKRPNISQLGVVRLPSNHFWRGIAWRSASSKQLLFGFVHVGESEVDDFESLMNIEQHVFWFDVSMRDAELMKILEAWDDLSKVMMSLSLIFAGLRTGYILPSMT